MYTLVMTVSVICLAFNLLVLLSFPVPCRPFESLFSQMFKWNHFPFSTVLTTNKPGRPCEKVVFFDIPCISASIPGQFPLPF
ncbi:hypothetical protein EDC96DRAFT_534869 [Choanephora cucurbitarum]|nr:hypothetical protein EDC96DRAFT_534869 [Choanephora cucurbitarum]